MTGRDGERYDHPSARAGYAAVLGNLGHRDGQKHVDEQESHRYDQKDAGPWLPESDQRNHTPRPLLAPAKRTKSPAREKHSRCPESSHQRASTNHLQGLCDIENARQSNGEHQVSIVDSTGTQSNAFPAQGATSTDCDLEQTCRAFTAEKLDSRLRHLESRLFYSFPHSSVPGRRTVGGPRRAESVSAPMSALDCDVQSTALRQTLLLEERGLQLDQAELLLKRKDGEIDSLHHEISQLKAAIAGERKDRRGLVQAEQDLLVMRRRLQDMEALAENHKADADTQRRGRAEEQKRHTEDIVQMRHEVTESEAFARRESAAAASCKDMCEQLGAVCRQMRKAAEDGAKRAEEAEEKVQSLRVELGLAKARAGEATRETGLQREAVRAATEAATDARQALQMEKDKVLQLKGVLQDLEAKLKRSEGETSSAHASMEEAHVDASRQRKACEDLHKEISETRSRNEHLMLQLSEAGAKIVSESERADRAIAAAERLREDLTTIGARADQLQNENTSFRSQVDKLNIGVAELSRDLTDARNMEEQSRNRSSQNEKLLKIATERELERKVAMEEAVEVAARYKEDKSKAETAFFEFQKSMAFALKGVEDACADVLQGVVGTGGVQALYETSGSNARRSESRKHCDDLHPCNTHDCFDSRRREHKGGGSAVRDHVPWTDRACDTPGTSGCGAGTADIRHGPQDLFDSTTTDLLRRSLSRTMGKLSAAGKLRTWVEAEVQGMSAEAMKGLKALRGRWDGELERLRVAEKSLAKLREQAKYGGRRAALEARDQCFAKLEKAEGEAWKLKSSLAQERRDVEATRLHLERCEEALRKARASASEDLRRATGDVALERLQSLRMRDKMDILREKCSSMATATSQLRRQNDELKASETNLQGQNDRLAQAEQHLQRELDAERCRSSEMYRELTKLKDDGEGMLHHFTERAQQLEVEDRRIRKQLDDGRAEAESILRRLDDKRITAERDAQRWQEMREEERSEKVREVTRLSALWETEKKARETEVARLAEALEEERKSREQEAFRSLQALERERKHRQEEMDRLCTLVQHEKDSKDEEANRLSALLDEEREARRIESAMGQAVLREVRASRSLLGQSADSEFQGEIQGFPPGHVYDAYSEVFRPSQEQAQALGSQAPCSNCQQHVPVREELSVAEMTVENRDNYRLS